MVSRLLSSISGMLSPPERDSTPNGSPKDDEERGGTSPDTTDNNIKTEMPIPIERKASSKMSNFDLQFINAETMDRAIVNRLQSRMSTSVADVLVETRPSATGVKLRCERSEAKVPQDPRAPQQQQSRAQLQDPRTPQQQQSRAQLQDPRTPQQQQSRAQLQDPRMPQQQQSRAQLQDPRMPQQQQSRAQLQDPRAPQQQQSRAQLQDPRAPQQQQPKVKLQDLRAPKQQQSRVQLQDPRAPQQQQSKVQLQDPRVPQQQQSRVQLQDPRAPPQQQSKVKLQETRSRPPQPPPKVLQERNERSYTRRDVDDSGEESEEHEHEDYTSDALSEQDRPPELLSENTRSRHRLAKESLSQSSVMAHDIPNMSANKQSLKKMVQHSVPPRASSADERRSVMYRNSQFSLENSSKEALCSDSSKLLPEPEDDHHTNSNALLHLPLFGIPDPSRHRHRMSSAASSSMESLPANERHNNRELPSRRAVSPTAGRSYYLARRLSVSQIDDRVFESSINDIIEKGGDEFKSKYSSWIWDAFRTQLVKLKSLMVQEFNEKLKFALEEREYEVSDLQKRYQDKLIEFDTSTENFQQLMDSMNKENQRMLSAKDFIIDKLKKEFLECKKHFEQDLQRQVQSFRKEAEVERMELQKRNDELMLIMLSDQSTSGLEDAFKNEINSLHAMIKTLNARNELLNQQLEEATNSSSAMNRRAVENLEAHLNEASSQLFEIQKKLQYADNEKEDLTVAHNQEIAKLNRKLQESSTKYEHQLRDAMDELATARKKHSREIKEFKQKMATQESQQKQLMAQVRQEYGSEVDTLSQAVCQLRAELTLRGASARLSQATKGNDSNIR